MNIDDLKIAGTALIAGLLGYGLGWRMNQSKTIPETPAPAVRQQDGSLVLERKPDAKPEPKHQLPAGSKLVRQVSVEVMPRISGSAPGAEASQAPVTVDLSLVQMKDGTQRVVASSPDGDVVGGVDIPVQLREIPHVDKNHVFTGYDPVGKGYLVTYDRKLLGPFGLGAALDVHPQAVEKVRGYVGISFNW